MNAIFAMFVSLFVRLVKKVSVSLWKLTYKTNSIGYYKLGITDRFGEALPFESVVLAVVTSVLVIAVVMLAALPFNRPMRVADAASPHVHGNGPAMHQSVVHFDVPTRMPVWSLNEDPHYTGPVSRVCNERDLFQYHNLDKVQCGFGASLKKVVHNVIVTVTATLTPDITTTETTVPTNTPDITPEVTSTPEITTTETIVPTLPGVTPEITSTPDVTSTPRPTNTPAPAVTEIPCNAGNPGNLKCNGGSGEDPNNKGTMPLDSTATPANGQHGNQGQGGNATKTPKPDKQDAAGLALLALLTAARKSKKDNWEFINAALWFGTTASLYKHNGVPCVCVMNGNAQLALEHFVSMAEAKAWRESSGKAIAMSAKQ